MHPRVARSEQGLQLLCSNAHPRFAVYDFYTLHTAVNPFDRLIIALGHSGTK